MARPRSTEWLTASQACDALGVKPATLYTYVSRGRLRRMAVAGGHRYHADDVRRLATRSAARRGHGPVAGGALRWGEAVLDSAITDVGPRGVRYRGHDVAALVAAGAAFETVCGLLWQCAPAGDWSPIASRVRRDPDVPGVWRFARALVAEVPPTDARPCAVDETHDLARRLVATFAACLGGDDVGAPIAVRLCDAYGVPRAAAGVFDAALVACADHELNVSTFAARVAASAGADVTACVGAALHVFTGAQHGAMCDRIERELARFDGDEDGLRGRLADGLVAGFGHPLYPEGDPRARAVLDAAARSPVRSRDGARAERYVDAVRALGGEPPAVDLAVVVLAAHLGLPPTTATALFALGRTAGWVAHVLEQRASPGLLRPRARYVGP